MKALDLTMGDGIWEEVVGSQLFLDRGEQMLREEEVRELRELRELELSWCETALS